MVDFKVDKIGEYGIILYKIGEWEEKNIIYLWIVIFI